MGEGGFVLSSWTHLPEPLVAETFLRAGFDAITLDAQHGLHDENSLQLGIERAALLGRPSIVRLPVDGRALASRVLDFGASGVIMPMIETADDARALVSVAKYPPLGLRSYGPARAGQLHGYASGSDYVKDTRGGVVALAMIETARAVAELDAILAVEGLDGVFVGPSDLSIALSGNGTLNVRGEQAQEAIADIAKRTLAAGKIPGIYALSPEDTQQYRGLGYRYVCVGSDHGVLAAGAAELARAARG